MGAEAEGLFTLFGVVFFFIGLALFGIGLLGEYVGRIYAQVRERPRYIVEAVLEEQRWRDPNLERSQVGDGPPGHGSRIGDHGGRLRLQRSRRALCARTLGAGRRRSRCSSATPMIRTKLSGSAACSSWRKIMG